MMSNVESEPLIQSEEIPEDDVDEEVQNVLKEKFSEDSEYIKVVEHTLLKYSVCVLSFCPKGQMIKIISKCLRCD